MTAWSRMPATMRTRSRSLSVTKYPPTVKLWSSGIDAPSRTSGTRGPRQQDCDDREQTECDRALLAGVDELVAGKHGDGRGQADLRDLTVAEP